MEQKTTQNDTKDKKVQYMRGMAVASILYLFWKSARREKGTTKKKKAQEKKFKGQTKRRVRQRHAHDEKGCRENFLETWKVFRSLLHRKTKKSQNY